METNLNVQSDADIEIIDLTPDNIADYGVCGYKDVNLIVPDRDQFWATSMRLSVIWILLTVKLKKAAIATKKQKKKRITGII